MHATLLRAYVVCLERRRLRGELALCRRALVPLERAPAAIEFLLGAAAGGGAGAAGGTAGGTTRSSATTTGAGIAAAASITRDFNREAVVELVAHFLVSAIMVKRSATSSKFPIARIKRIMQADEDVGKVAQATPVVICACVLTGEGARAVYAGHCRVRG